jgi:hypothetical protein
MGHAWGQNIRCVTRFKLGALTLDWTSSIDKCYKTSVVLQEDHIVLC